MCFFWMRIARNGGPPETQVLQYLGIGYLRKIVTVTFSLGEAADIWEVPLFLMGVQLHHRFFWR